MINITPLNDLKPHKEDNTCDCNPKTVFENGEMILIHNSYDGRELDEAIKQNSKDLKKLYDENKITKEEIIELRKQAEYDEEYEVAISIRDVLNIIQSTPKPKELK